MITPVVALLATLSALAADAVETQPLTAVRGASLTLREALADADRDEGLRVALKGIEGPLDADGDPTAPDLTGASVRLLPGDYDLDPIRFEPGCQWWDPGCDWSWSAPRAAGTPRIVDSTTGFVRVGYSLLRGVPTPLVLTASVTDGVEIRELQVPVTVIVGGTAEADLWTEVYCTAGVCFDAEGKELATYDLDRDLALRVRAVGTAKGDLRVELQSDRQGCGDRTCGDSGHFFPPLSGDITVTLEKGTQFLLEHRSTRLDVVADAATAALVKDKVGMRQGEAALDWALVAADGTVLWEDAGVLEVDIRDLVLRRGRVDFDEVDGLSFTYTVAASRCGGCQGSWGVDDVQVMDVRMAVTDAGGEVASETVTVVHQKVERVLTAPVPAGGNAPGSDLTATVTALNADGKSLGVIGNCGFTQDTGSRCSLSGGFGEVRLGKPVATEQGDGFLVEVTFDALADADGDGLSDATFDFVEVTLKGAAGSGTATDTRDVFLVRDTAAGFEKLTPAFFAALAEPYVLTMTATTLDAAGQITGVLTESSEDPLAPLELPPMNNLVFER